MKPVTLFGYEGGGYAVDPLAQQVDNPQRALEKFSSETKVAAFKNIVGSVIVAFFVFGLPILWFSLWREESSFPGSTIILLLFPVVLIVFIISMKEAIKRFSLAAVVPKRQTAEETVRTFLEAIEDRLWNRAYSCLTDSAQKVGTVELQKIDYLQEMMPDIRIYSAESFRSFWSRIKFTFKPQWDLMRSSPMNAQTTKVIVPLRATWQGWWIGQQGQKGELIEDFECPFLAVERDGYWFLANGFFWPEGLKYLTEEGGKAT